MRRFLRKLARSLRGANTARDARHGARRLPLQVETLEERQLLSVTSAGGAVLPNVEATPVFYGSGWHANAQTEGDAAYLTAFLGDVVNSPYMDMLGNAGYGVGRGSADGATFVSDGQSEPDYLPKSQILSDSSIQSNLEGWINSDPQFAGGPFGFGNLQPDDNRLYVIFVEPGVEVSAPVGSPAVTWTSGKEAGVNHFFGYHGSFVNWDNSGNPEVVRYAVMPYLDGATNGKASWLSTRDNMTETASHELAEAVTDPDGGTYQDYSTGGQEIGDIVANEVVYQHGYAVQRLADMNDKPITPSDATPQRQVTFVVRATSYAVGIGGSLVTTNQLFERTPDGVLRAVQNSDGTYIYNIRSISDQGIDNHGKAMIDVVSNAGNASEYHDDGTWTYLGNGIKDAKAGQGASYVLFSDGTLKEWRDGSPNGGTIDPAGWTKIDTNVSAIDAGTDARGANMVAEIWFGQAWTFSDSTGWHYIANGVAQASAGRFGTVDFVTTSGNVFWWNEGAGPAQQLSDHATKVTAGYNADGSEVIDILFRNGTVQDYRNGAWQQLDYNVHDLTKARAGVVDTISNAGNAWEFPTRDGYFLVLGATRNPFASTWAVAMA